jgi:hypothetical protein
MAKQLKDQPIGARITAEMKKEVDHFVEHSEDMSLGRLIRLGIQEYMWGHPIETTKKGK